MKNLFINIFLLLILYSCNNDLGIQSTRREFNGPTDVPNLILWFDAADITNGAGQPANGANINTNWVDKSGNGNNISLLTGVSPVLVSEGLNGLDVVNFLGTGALSGNFSSTFTNPKFTAFIVMNMSTGTQSWGGAFVMSRAGANDFSDDGTSCIFIRRGGDFIVTNWRATLNVQAQSGTLDAWHMYATSFLSGNEMVMRMDGVEEDRAVFADRAMNSTKFTLGGRLSPNEGFFLNGRVAEVILYEGELDPVHVSGIENYLLTKWGL